MPSAATAGTPAGRTTPTTWPTTGARTRRPRRGTTPRHSAPTAASGPKGGTVPDGADTLYGDDGDDGAAAGHDLLAGDNASLIRPVQPAGPGTRAAATSSGAAPSTTTGGGNGSDDGQGNNGQDDIVGGTGRTRTDNPASADDGRLDVGDTLYGGNGNPTEENDGSDVDDYDVVMGDNATVLRGATGAPGETWAHHDYAGTGVRVVTRTVTVHDVAALAYAPAAGSSGGDTLYGEDADDLDDGGDDVVEGNAGADQLFGEGDEDDMLGATGLVRDWDDPAGVVKTDTYPVADLVGGTAGRADGADTMYAVATPT